METVLASIVSGIAAGALAKAGDIGGQAMLDAYGGLKGGIIKLLGGKSGSVQSVEEEPTDEAAQRVLAQKLASEVGNPENGEKVAELKRLADTLNNAIASVSSSGTREASNIDISEVRAKTDLIIRELVATGSIKMHGIESSDGPVTIEGVFSGVDQTAQTASQKKT